jgi:hypothetical protein
MAKRGATKQEKAARAKPAPQVSLENSPARSIVLKKISELRDNPRNVKTHPVGQLAALDQSFGDHGQVKPLVINEDGVLLAGHGSRAALAHLFGEDAEVACVIVRQDETMQRKFMLRDNAAAELSGWKKDGLGLELVDLKSIGVPDLAALGFKSALLKKFDLVPRGEESGVKRTEAAAAASEEVAPALVVARPDDIWLLGRDCLTVSDDTLVARAAVDAAIAAWEKSTKKRAILAAGELTFEAAAAARGQEAVGLPPADRQDAPAAIPLATAAGASSSQAA